MHLCLFRPLLSCSFFVVDGYQGAEEDADQLQLSDKLLQAVLAEDQVVCIGQPMLIAGYLNADPAVIPSLLRVFLLDGILLLLLLILWVLVLLLMSPDCLTGRRALVHVVISLLAVLMLLLHLMPVMSLIGGSLLTFLSWLTFALVPGRLTLLARLHACLFGLLVGWTLLIDRSSLSSSRVVQDVWDVKKDDLGVVPEEVVMALRDAASGSSVDDFWTIWSRIAELGLFRAYSKAGGPVVAGSSAFLGRGLLRIRSRRFTQARWDALLGYWRAVCRHGPCGPISSLHPWDNWVLPDLHGFYRWVFDSLKW